MKTDPYWWDAAPLSAHDRAPVAPSCDVAIVGAGYTGLSAAIVLARAGRHVQVFDRQRPGEGASTRNGGITSGNLRPSAATMARRFGAERSAAIIREGVAAREDLYRFIAEEKIDCDFALTGRFSGAIDDEDCARLAQGAAELRSDYGIEAFAVPREKVRDYIGTSFYRGGAVRMDIGGIDPAKFHAGMLRVALGAGAAVHGLTPVSDIEASGEGFRMTTPRGEVRAREVVMATNGYTDGVDGWLRRRIVPVRSRIVATEPIEPALMDRLVPKRTMLSDSRELSYYYRPSPDGTRILFGGRDGRISGETSSATERLRRVMTGIFPELDGIGLSHSWFGKVGMNRDMVPRVFSHSGARYGVGYCGSGTVWARWLGQKIALAMLAEQGGETAFDFRPPAAVPLYTGTPWFLPAIVAGMGIQDWLKLKRAGR